MPESTLITTLLGISALLLGLALLVQVLQEMYKFLTKSKSRTYTAVLQDVLGPWVRQLLRPDAIPNLQIRGPLQFLRLRPQGLLLPLDQENLVGALESTAPGWVQRALRKLRSEVALQKGQAEAPSVGWCEFVTEMERAERDAATPGHGNLLEVRKFFEARDAGTKLTTDSGARSGTLDAARLLQEFRAEFLKGALEAERTHPQLMKNFEYSYQRRNLRHSFTIALIVALLFQFPITAIYHRANAMTASEAVAAAEQALALKKKVDELTPKDKEQDKQKPAEKDASKAADKDAKKPVHNEAEKLERVVGELQKLIAFRQNGERPKMCALLTWGDVKALWAGGVGRILGYLVACLVTAILISFGAPFWNDLAGALLRMKKGAGQPGGGSGNGAATSSGTTGG